MAEDTARALGAASSEVVMIAGKECRPRPLTIKELTEVERECLRLYKRSYLSTFSENADLLPEEDAKQLIREKMEEVAKWDVTSLPPKSTCDHAKVKVTPKLTEWIEREMGSFKTEGGVELPKEVVEKKIQIATAYAIDSGMLSIDKYQEMTGEVPFRAQVPYSNWWITGCYEGILTMVWQSFKEFGVTKDDIARELGRNPAMMASYAHEVERLTAPQSGNG